VTSPFFSRDRVAGPHVLSSAVSPDQGSRPDDNFARGEVSLRHQHAPPLLILHKLHIPRVRAVQRVALALPLLNTRSQVHSVCGAHISMVEGKRALLALQGLIA
jgi:hypothetical protein